MTQEEKQLLLKDLCSRLPYGNTEVKVTEPTNDIMDEVFVGKHICSTIDIEDFILGRFIVKPYLRPMSSMTEEELIEFGWLKYQDNEIWEIVEMRVVKHDFLNIKCRNKHNGVSAWIFQISRTEPLRSWKGIDWLNAHHFDYRGLIEKGLALEALKMYKEE